MRSLERRETAWFIFRVSISEKQYVFFSTSFFVCTWSTWWQCCTLRVTQLETMLWIKDQPCGSTHFTQYTTLYIYWIEYASGVKLVKMISIYYLALWKAKKWVSFEWAGNICSHSRLTTQLLFRWWLRQTGSKSPSPHPAASRSPSRCTPQHSANNSAIK